MLTEWYGMASYCQDSNGFCRHTGGICRPGACPMSEHVVIPDDDERNDNNE